MISRPDPSSVSGPSPWMPSVKMVGNMIEWKNPTRISAHMASGPVVVTVTSITMNAPIEKAASTVSARTRCMSAEPRKRPTIMPPHRNVR